MTVASTEPPRQSAPIRPRHMNINHLLNGPDPGENGPPNKYQRLDSTWGQSRKATGACFEPSIGPRSIASRPKMGPPDLNDNTRIQHLLNTPEPDKSQRNCVPMVSKIICETCGEGFTCDSLLRKHQAKHTKPFKCKQKGCERMHSGFTSPNDLKRHENSVHKGTKGPAIGYNCVYDHCRDRNKIYFRLDNFRNHLKKLHSTRDSTSMPGFLKQAEHECRVEVSPEDVNQESASETNSSVRRSRSAGSVSFRNNKKLQWVITRVDNGNLHRPRPAYYGPLEEDSSDCAVDMDPSDMDSTSVHNAGSTGMAPTSPGHSRMESEPMSPRISDHPAQQWTPIAAARNREEDMARRNEMKEIQNKMDHLRREWDSLEERYRMLEAEENKSGPQVIPQETPIHAGFPVPHNPRVPNVQDTRNSPALNTRTLEEIPANSNETMSRFFNQRPAVEERHPAVMKQPDNRVPIPSRKRNPPRPENEGSTVEMLSPPETVASPPRDNLGIIKPGQVPPEAQRRSTTAGPLPSPARVQPPPNPSGRGKAAQDKPFHCQHTGCKSKFARNCELKKHGKRHTRPYGCTARFCQRMFGSKNDWKRHENTQHHRLESWKCSVPINNNSGELCNAMHYRKENFVNHLKSSAHGIKEEQKIRDWAENSYIGGSGHPTFWCGFCYTEQGVQGKIINMKNQDLAGWDERFNHLGNHFENGCSIKDYKYQDEDTVRDCSSLSDEDGEDEDDEDDSLSPRGAPSESASLLQLANAAESINLAPSKNHYWFCCQCRAHGEQQYPWSSEIVPSCLQCQHGSCQHCIKEFIPGPEDTAPPKARGTRRKRQ